MITSRNKYNDQKQRHHNYSGEGFTLVETLVAIAILLLAVTGPLMLSRNTLSTGIHTQGGTTAQYLAEDAVEYVKAVRANNRKAGNDWLAGLDPCINDSCTIDTTKVETDSSAINDCGGSCPPLRFNTATAQYGYDSGWDESPYTRSVSIEEFTGNDHEVFLTVTVDWNFQGRSRSLTVKRLLFKL